MASGSKSQKRNKRTDIKSMEIHPMHFLGYIQVFFEGHLLHHISLSVSQRDIKIWSTHPDVISMKVSIHGNRSTSHPTWEVPPVLRQVDSWLWARGAKKRKASRSRNWFVNLSETFRNLQLSHLPVDSNQFHVSVL